MLLSIIGQLALIRLALKPSITVAGAIERGARRMPIYLASALILVAGLLVIAIPFGIAAKAMGIPLESMQGSFPPSGWLLLLLFIVVIIYIATRMMMTAPVGSAEQVGPIAIIQRSWNLTKGHTGKLLGFVLMICVAAIVVLMVVAIVAGSLAAMLLGPAEAMSASALFIGIIEGLFQAAFTALFAVMGRTLIAVRVLQDGKSYLTDRGYEIVSGWGSKSPLISPDTINWKAVADGTQQIYVRQRPGPANSLGRFKFDLPHGDGIYLHDTPKKELFAQDQRALSHGCVRLEDAQRLATWLLGRDPPPPAPSEEHILLPHPVPITISYLNSRDQLQLAALQ